MTLEEAIKKSIQRYYAGKNNHENSFKEMKYTKQYFDDFEKEISGVDNVKKSNKKIDKELPIAISISKE